MHIYLIEMLDCPACHSKLDWSITERNENRIEMAEAHCNTCAATYPVRDGIGLFLTPELQGNDLWEQVDSGLIQHLREHPELEHQLMEVPLDTLAPTDQFWLIGNRRDSAIYGGGWQRGDNLLNRERGAGKGVRCWIIRSSGVSGL